MNINVNKHLCPLCACYKEKTKRCYALKEIPETDCKFFADKAKYYRDKKSGYILEKNQVAMPILNSPKFAIMRVKERD